MNRYTFCLFLLLGISLQVRGQLPSDVIRYSTLDYLSTARTLGINGAINSLGADFSVLSSNPAGLATYRRSEFTFTPGLYTTEVTSLLEGSENNVAFVDNRGRFNFGNVGLVFSSRPTGSNWKTANFGFGLNRVADFHSNSIYSGQSVGSVTDRWVELADGLTPDELGDFETGLAYDAGAIFNPFPYDNTLYGNDFSPTEIVDKGQIVRTEGGINELVFSLAGNYDEKLMIGATVGVPFVNYEETKEYRETDEENKNPVFEELILAESLQTSGTGINLKMGFIYRPIQAFRIGASVHTPTSYNMEDTYETQLLYDFSQGPFEAQSPIGLFEYRVRTPWRVNGGASFMFGKFGFISTEVEWIDYSSASFNFNSGASLEDEEYEQFLNQEIQDNFQSALNIRVGGEAALGKLRLRLGYGIQGSPYVGDSNSAGQSFSGGVGVRERNFFLDLGYRYQAFGQSYVPYIVAGDNKQLVTNDFINQQILLTFGFRFN